MPTDEIIDPATFAGLLDSLGGDVEFLSELVDAYLDSSPGLLASMQQALASGEAPALQRAAHSLKTGSASFGALAFAGLCKGLEELAKTGALDGAAEKYEALEAGYAQVAAALQVKVDSARSAPA
jgi:HPt (histidine-containing phosphotransfer) domain-containing protein